MAIAQKFVGEDIFPAFNLEISTGIFRNLDNAADIFVVFSNGANSVKFTKNTKTGYPNILTRVDEYNYMAILTSAHTVALDIGHVKMAIRYEFNSALGDLKDTIIEEETAIYLSPNKLQTV